MASGEAADNVFRALADPSRGTLLDALFAQNGQTLSELAAYRDMTRQAWPSIWSSCEAPNVVVSIVEGARNCTTSTPMPILEIGERWIFKYERRASKRRAI